MSDQNIPGPQEHFVIPPGEVAVAFDIDPRVPDTVTYELNRQDHTLGNLLRCQLLRDPRTIFSGYLMPHPLKYTTLLRVRSIPETTPTEITYDACSVLADEVADLMATFETEFDNHLSMK